MKQIHSFDELRQIKDTKVYALGTFDGIHRGHQRVIRKLLKKLHQLMVLALSLP